MREKQVDKSYYEFTHYMDSERWMSFYCQIEEFHKLEKPDSILEIGPGLPINRNHVKEHLPKVSYKTLDIAEDLEPDIVGSADSIPLPDKSFDVVVAFEILEHLPFERFEVALEEIKRVARNDVIISLPHFGPPVRFKFKAPFLPEIEWAFKIWVPLKHRFNGQHYWEIGKRGYSPKFIRGVISKHFFLVREYVPFWNQYHHFYVLKVK